MLRVRVIEKVRRVLRRDYWHRKACRWLLRRARFREHCLRQIALDDALLEEVVSIHEIDLRDHRDFTRPLDFLELDAEEYYGKHPGGENRWRASDFLDAFANAGACILGGRCHDKHMELTDLGYTDTWSRLLLPLQAVAKVEALQCCEPWVTRERRQRFVLPYREKPLEDLSILVLSLICRKPAATGASRYQDSAA